MFSTLLENFLPFSSNLKLSSANSPVWKSLKFVVWERVNLYKSEGKYLTDVENRYIVLLYIKNILGELIVFEPCHDNYHFFQTS